jgi:hypothetical protein
VAFGLIGKRMGHDHGPAPEKISWNMSEILARRRAFPYNRIHGG